jgi:hypothetical protein
MGRKITVERRRANAFCFNGRDYERERTVQNCSCRADDYEWFVFYFAVIRCYVYEAHKFSFTLDANVEYLLVAILVFARGTRTQRFVSLTRCRALQIRTLCLSALMAAHMRGHEVIARFLETGAREEWTIAMIRRLLRVPPAVRSYIYCSRLTNDEFNDENVTSVL